MKRIRTQLNHNDRKLFGSSTPAGIFCRTQSLNRRIIQILAIGIILLLSGSLAWADQPNTGSRFHNLGTLKWRVDPQLWLDTSGNDFTPIAAWPQGVYDSENCQFWWFQILPLSFVDSLETVHVKERQIGISVGSLSALGSPWGIYEYRRYAPPSVYVNGSSDTFDFNGEVTDTLMSDVMTVVNLKSPPGFHLSLKTYSFANPFHDDYVINHLNIKYTGNSNWENDLPDIPEQPLDSVWFALGYHMVPSFAGQKEITGNRWGGNAWDDWMDWTDTIPQYPSGLDTDRPDMNMVFAWDGDDSDVTELEAGAPNYFDDRGDPSFTHDVKGQFLSYQWPGYTLLHADSAPDSPDDDASQPRSLALASIFEVWPGMYGGMIDYDYFSTGTRQHPETPNDPANSHWKQSDHMFMGIGPYHFTEWGEDVDLVWSVGVGGISWQETFEKGQEWLDWHLNGNGSFDDDAKRALLDQGKDSLYTVLSRSRWAWDKIRNGEQIPAPLPAPWLEVSDGGGFIKLEWEDLSGTPDPVTGIPDLDHYRIYRKVGAYLINFKEDEFGKGINYELIAEVPSTETEYYDTTAVRGESYHYYVTAVDDGSQNISGLIPGAPLESSHFINRTRSGASSFKPAPAHSDSVRIVPNPYVISAGELNYTGDNNKILFVNLPAYCTVRIYNTTGDLIRKMEHTSGSGDEAWDLLSQSSQRVVSGVYILHVSNCRTLEGADLPDVVEKFVIVR